MKSFLMSWHLCLLLVLFPVISFSASETKGAKKITAMTQEGESIELYQQSHALLIGVSNYTAGWRDLKNIPAELEQVREMLIAQGFNVILKLDPNAEELEKIFSEFVKKYGYYKNNRLLFFYSGHGYSRDNHTKGYLVPTDAPLPDNDDDVGFLQKALNMTQVLSWSRQMEAKHALFLFDSCFSGTIFKTKSNTKKRPVYISKATAQKVRQFITAGSDGEEVPAKSTFTPMFVDAIRFS